VPTWTFAGAISPSRSLNYGERTVVRRSQRRRYHGENDRLYHGTFKPRAQGWTLGHHHRYSAKIKSMRSLRDCSITQNDYSSVSRFPTSDDDWDIPRASSTGKRCFLISQIESKKIPTAKNDALQNRITRPKSTMHTRCKFSHRRRRMDRWEQRASLSMRCTGKAAPDFVARRRRT
jgi:hypothetical protein